MGNPVQTIRTATQRDQGIWDNYANHPLQSWAWGDFRIRMGIDLCRLVVEKNNKIVEVWQLTFHRIPKTPWTIGYFPKGPQPTQFMVSELKKLAHQKNAIYTQLEPNTTSAADFLPPSHRPLFTKYTFVLDLTKSEEELLGAMHPKTRYNIKQARKHGVTIEEDSSTKAFDAYLRLIDETQHRQGFLAHNTTYHKRMWEILHKAGMAKLFTATYDGKTLAAWILFAFKKTLYYPYGTSSRQHREVMAPTLLLWEIACWAKKKGYERFDLWGALGPDPDTKSPWYGFHRFKQGFSPDLISFAGSYDLIHKPNLYRLYTVIDKFRWFVLTRNA